MEVRLVWCRERWRLLFVPVVPEAEAEVNEEEPPLSEYLKLTKATHVIVAQALHQRVQIEGVYYIDHRHVIRDTDSESDKNRLAAHIDTYHRGGTVG